MSGYLVYHPARAITHLDGHTVYHDHINGNQDPYIWNTQFLHTYCHITQMSAQEGDINFWVSGNTFPLFTELYCDLIFTVQEKIYWPEANHITRHAPVVDSDTAFHDHYQWVWQHPFKRRRRFTLKATRSTSFQPQDSHGNLINILPLLQELGFSLDTLQRGLRAGFNSKPMRLEQHAEQLFLLLSEGASIKHFGESLALLRAQHHYLAS